MIKKAIEQRNEELKPRETKLDSVKMELDEHCKDLSPENEQLVVKIKEVVGAKSSAASCDLEIETSVISVRKNLTSVAYELSLKKEKLESVAKELEGKEKETEKVKLCAMICHEEFELKQKGLAMVNGLINDCHDELELKKKQLEKLQGLIGICSDELDLKEGKLRGIKDSICQCQIELDLKKKELDATERMIEEKQKLVEYNPGFTATIDGKALQIYLNEHSKELDSMRITVSMAFAHSPDPSMLVLDALQGIYPPHLKNGVNTEFEGTVVKKSCSLLLEELMNLSPEIQPHVKIEASRIASDWLATLTIDEEHSLEILCFLQLLCSYGLASAVDPDKLLNMLEIVKIHRPAPALFRALGFANKASGVVRRFIQDKKLIEAINFINTFEMNCGGLFRPVSLLNEFLRKSKIATKKLRKESQAQEAQIDASKKRLADVKYALRCIEECKIDYGPSVKNLEMQVTLLEREISRRKEEAALRDKTRKSNDEEKNLAPVVAVKEIATSSANVATAGPPHQLSGIKRPRAEKISKECQAFTKVSEKEILDGREAEVVVVGEKNLEEQATSLEKEINKRKEEAARKDKTRKSNDEEKHLGPVVPAIAVKKPATVGLTSGLPHQLSGNKRPMGDVLAGKISKDCRASIKISDKEIVQGNAEETVVGDKIRAILHDWKKKRTISSVKVPTDVKQVIVDVSSKKLESNKASASLNRSKEDPEKLLDMCEKNPLEDGEIASAIPGNLVSDELNVYVPFIPDYLPFESNEASASLDLDLLSVDPSKEEMEKFLEMHEKNQLEDSKIGAVLQSASDPRKLVLDIMNVPVPFVADETEEFKVNIPKSSCILLLKQLREVVIPEVNPEIRDEAKKFALFWQTTLAKKPEKSPLDAICFLQFLASFNLGSVFDPNQLLDLLDSDHWRKEAPDLCEILGLSDKIPSFIENRIKKGKHIEAVKYIYALNMVDKFPPVPVLEDFLSNSSKKPRKRPVRVQINDIDNEIKSLEDVIKCVTDYTITGISLLKIEESIVQLKIKRDRASEASNIKPGLSGSYKRARTNILPDYRVPLHHPALLYLPPGPFVWQRYPPQWH